MTDPNAKLVWLLAGAVILGMACKSVPMYSHGNFGYESPAHQTCGSGGEASTLEIRVEDAARYGLPAATVYAAEMGTSEVAVRTADENGVAVFEVPGGKAYVITAALWGFRPATRAIQMTGGCTGRTTLVLDVGGLN